MSFDIQGFLRVISPSDQSGVITGFVDYAQKLVGLSLDIDDDLGALEVKGLYPAARV